MVTFVSRILIALCLLLPVPLLASEGGNEGNSMTGGGSGAGLSSATTKKVVRILNRAGGECGGLPQVYRYDCYRFAYKRAADELAGRPAYREAFQALAKVEMVLEQEVQRNADPSVRPLRRGFTTYNAVKPEAVPRVNSRAVSALQEAETVLLRSGDDKGIHYANIAQAVNSNKVILRSALLLLPGLGPLIVLLA